MDYRLDHLKIEVYVSFLYPGMILKGDGFDETGNKVIDRDVPLTKDVIQRIKDRGVKKIFYTRERLKLRKEVSRSMISDQNVEEAVSLIDDIQGSIKTEGAKANFPSAEVDEVVKRFVGDIRGNSDAYLNLLDLVEYNDYTYTHSINVSTIAVLLGISLKMDEEKIRILGIAGLLHDIGKTLIPESIIDKPDKLTEQEWNIIKNHPVYSYNIVHAEQGFGPVIENAILCHHENYNGGGYPFGVNHEKLGPYSQIVMIADVFDAATSRRPYKEPWSFDQAFAFFMENSGKKFHPVYVQAFLRDMTRKINETPLYPEGCYVLLNTGEIGVVMGYRQSEYTLRPIVNIFLNQNLKGEDAKKLIKHPLQIDLEVDYSRFIVKRIIEDGLIQKCDQLLEKK